MQSLSPCIEDRKGILKAAEQGSLWSCCKYWESVGLTTGQNRPQLGRLHSLSGTSSPCPGPEHTGHALDTAGVWGRFRRGTEL